MLSGSLGGGGRTAAQLLLDSPLVPGNHLHLVVVTSCSD
jgi:hypothetical protein